MTYDHSFEERAKGYALCLAAGGVARYLESTSPQEKDMVPLDLCVDATLDYLESALRAPEIVNNRDYKGTNVGRDLTNSLCLMEINPEFAGLGPEDFVAEVSKYIDALRALRQGKEVPEKRKLASLCGAIARYTFSRLKPGSRSRIPHV
ncbi:hypothetical protein KY331_05950 [Candidatus Woesearchaeota archaeon]|nr:hypothetical protein [Candidatus Woesearchaeota archaeon]